MDQAYAQGMTVTVPLSQTFGFTTTDPTNCPFTTVKVFVGSTELYSGDYNTGTYTFPSSTKGSSAYQIEAFTASSTTV